MTPANPRRTAPTALLTAALSITLLAWPCLAMSQQATATVGAAADDGTQTGVIDLREAYLQPGYWQDRQASPDRELLDRAGIAAQNARMRDQDEAIHTLHDLPDTLAAADVRNAINALSRPPTRTLYGVDGTPITARQLKALQANLGLAKVPANRPLRYGLVTHRADLRTFPTALRVFSTVGDTDIDRFQESALFPGDAVAVLHESADGQWLFVTSERYSAWIEARHVGIGSAEQVLGYGQQAPYRVVTGATAFTAYTPEEPRVSRLQLDMGVRLPVLADWPAQQAVNGQQAHAAHVVQLPVRNPDGSLALVPALLPRSQDTSADYLPLTTRNLIGQAFKFLGERYGWGHAYGTRDCSGFVSEIYRSFGILLPRNTSAQAVSPALDRVALSPDASAARRQQAVAALQVGDLIYIPGHVMMAIGQVDGRTWLIHDTAGGSWLGADGQRIQAHLNGVSVTPLEPMMASDTVSYIDRITNIQRIRPQTQE